jgi:hypothetical protein
LEQDAQFNPSDAVAAGVAVTSEENLLAEPAEESVNGGTPAAALDRSGDTQAHALEQSVAAARIGNLANALCEDIVATPADAILREVAEDHGEPRTLAAAFDIAVQRSPGWPDAAPPAPGPATQTMTMPTVASPQLAETRLATTVRMPAAVASLLETTLAALSGLLVATSNRTRVIGVLAAILLVAVLAAGAYQQLSDRSTELIATGSVDRAATRKPETRPVGAGLPVPAGAPTLGVANPDAPGTSTASVAAAAPTPPGQSPLATPTQIQPQRDGAEQDRLAALSQNPEISQPAIAPPLPAEPAVPPANSPDQVRKAQIELKRLGCFNGPETGTLGNMTQDAVRTYWRRTGRRGVTIDITDAFIAELAQHGAGLCKPKAPAVVSPRPRPDQAPREPATDAGRPPRPPRPIAAAPPAAARTNTGGGF